MTYLLAVLASMANACSSVLQRKANLSEPDQVAFSARLVADLLRRPVWLLGVLAIIAGFLLQAVALGRGALAVVEPLLVLELPFTLMLAKVVLKRRVRRAQWVSAVATAGGLALLMASLSPHGGSVGRTGAASWVLGLGVATLVAGALVGLGRRRHGSRRAGLLAAATGITFGTTAALMTAMSGAAAHHLLSVLATWQTYAMVVTGLSAMYFLQNALQAGPLVVVQPYLTLLDPVVSLLWGVLLFHEQVQTGWWVAGSLAGAGVVVWGTLALSHSPATTGPAAPAR